ncbi:MAG TPA: YezD family protein [Pirellulales bacterium]|jgi:hypothetical protein|nr:YezD family protein [Pirellulales bacterium]
MTAEGSTQDPEDLPKSAGTERSRHEEALEQIRHALHGLRFGLVTVIVQDGVVVQIDRTEKTRLASKPRRH